jgi:hypothetical protein
MTGTARPNFFVSFWHICLDNLPEGAFEHRRITPAEAKALIAQARRKKRLLGVSEDDLLAPYRKRERQNHDKLRNMLKKHFGISLSFKDFLTSDDLATNGIYTINSLNTVRLRESDGLLIVSCRFTLADGKRPADLAFKLEPTSIIFHMIEARESVDTRAATARKKRA